MDKSKTVYLIFFLIFLVIVLVAVQIFKTRKDQGRPEQGETGQAEKVQQAEQKPDFKIISSSPSDKPIGVTTPFKIKFSKPVALVSVIYEIKPQEQVTISLDSTGTEVVFEHIQAWNFDTIYTIKLLKSTISSDFVPLDKDYEFTFKTASYSGI